MREKRALSISAFSQFFITSDVPHSSAELCGFGVCLLFRMFSLPLDVDCCNRKAGICCEWRMNGNVWAWGPWMKHTAAKEFSAWTMLLAGKLPNAVQLVWIFQYTQFWRKGARRKSWWLTQVRQNEDTDHYQLLKVTKRHYPKSLHCCQPRRTEEIWGEPQSWCHFSPV